MKKKINMAYRFSDSSKWADPWFVDLSANEKLMFIYMCDNCDIAGFLDLSLKKMAFDLSLDNEDVKVCFKGLESRYFTSIDRRAIFIKNFIKHQKNLPLNENNKAHQGIFKRFETYSDRFEVDLFQYITKGKHIKFKGLVSPTGNGNGIIELLDYKKGVDFEIFWNMYAYKVGSKEIVKKKWDSLQKIIQDKIIETLPLFLKHHPVKQFRPHPETYLNNQRWNDEIDENTPIQGIDNKYPIVYSRKFESTLQGADLQEYWKWLRDNGYVPQRDMQRNIVDWIKKAS